MSADTARLRELLDAASPGPWEDNPTAHDWECGIRDADRYPLADFGSNADAGLVMEAVNALPSLLGELDRLREVVARVEALHTEHDHSDPLGLDGGDQCFIIHGGPCARSDTCTGCRHAWPCPTLRALRGGDDQ